MLEVLDVKILTQDIKQATNKYEIIVESTAQCEMGVISFSAEGETALKLINHARVEGKEGRAYLEKLESEQYDYKLLSIDFISNENFILNLSYGDILEWIESEEDGMLSTLDDITRSLMNKFVYSEIADDEYGELDFNIENQVCEILNTITDMLNIDMDEDEGDIDQNVSPLNNVIGFKRKEKMPFEEEIIIEGDFNTVIDFMDEFTQGNNEENEEE